MKSPLRVPFVHISQIASLLLAFAMSTEVFGQSNHSVSFSGSTSDFNAAEKISAAAGNTDYYITFDGSNLYLGAFRTAGNFASADNFTVYLDTDPESSPTSGTGTTIGHSYNGVTGSLPFSANYVVHAEESAQEARIDTASWSTTISGLSYNTGSTWREVAIPFSTIGNPDALYLTMWMGQSSAIYSNAPGTDLGSGANPSVTDYFGGFGVSSADCLPASITNLAITASAVNTVPSAGITYGKISVTAGTITATNNFNLAPGGSIDVSAGTLDISGRTILTGGAVGSGRGVTIQYSGGSLISDNSTTIDMQGEGRFTGSTLTFSGNLIARQQVIPLASGGTIFDNGSKLDLRNGGTIVTNAPSYSAGSTLAYNTGNTRTASIEWTAGAASGIGVPHHVIIGDVVANSAVSFGGSTQYRRSAGDLIISNATSGNGISLSTAAGGDLQVGRNFTQNGTFTHNGRSLTMNGSVAQQISGGLNTAGATNCIPSLIIANTSGGVTLNNDARITSTTGNVLTIQNAGSLNIAGGSTLLIEGNGGNILSSGGARVIQLNAANSALNITGTKTFTSASGGAMSLNALASGATVNLNAAVNFGSGITTIGNNTYLQINAGGSVSTNAPTYHSGSTLVYNQGGTLSAATEWVANATSGAGVPGSVLMGNGVNTTLNFGASAQYRYAASNVQISASSALTLSSAAGGNLQLGGNFVNSGTFTHNSRDVIFNGSSAQQISGTTTFHNVTLNNASGLTLNNSITVANVLTMTAGSLTLGANNLTLSNTATGAITGTFSSSRMIITNGNGQLIRAIATSGLPITYNFPVGDNTGTVEYSPASFAFSANGAARNIGVRVVDGNHPQLNTSPTQTDYLSRYWAISNSAASTYTYTPSFTYPAADLNGSESNVRMNMYNGSSWSHLIGSSSASNVLGSGGSLTNATMPLGATAEFTGRVNDGNTYVWNQTGTANFTTAANWTPNRTTPAVNDILVFNNNATTTATNVSSQTIGRLVISGTTNVSFTSTSDVTLTIAGGNGNDLSIASGATMQLSSTGNNDLTIAFANASTGDISGTFTLNGNTTNGNRLITANSVTTVSGSLNNFGTVTSATTTLTFAAASNYRHNYTTSAGAIPVASWNATSNCIIQGYTSNTAAPSNLNQTFGNFTWNCTSQGEDINLNGALTDIAGNFTVSSTGGSTADELFLVNNTNTTINVGGNFAISGANTEVRLSSGNGNYTVNMNVAGAYTQSTASSILMLTEGNVDTKVNFRVAGLFNFNSGTITQNTGGTPSLDVLIEFNGTSAQNVNIVGSFTNEINFKVNNPAGINLSGTIPVIDDCSFYRTAGTITGGTINYGASNTKLIYDGASPMTTSSVEWPTSNDPEDITINSTSTVSLHASRTVENDGVFTNESGIFILGSNDLTLSNTSAASLVNASPSATNMIAADGSGQLKRTLPNSGRDLYFYIGDMTGTTEYSGFRLNFSANSLNGRVVGVRVVDDTSAYLSLPYSPIDYLSRHWIVTLSSNSGSYSYDPALAYNVAGDVNGTENNLQVAAFPASASSWNHYATSIVSPTLTKTGTDLTQANFSLNNAQFTGRTPVKYWNGSVSTSWTVAANWTPSGVPTSTDNIDFNGNADNPCVLSSSATVNHLTFSDGGNFTAASGASLTVAGNFTYNPLASVSFNCNSSLSLTNTTFNQFIPALQYGTLNLGTGARTLASADTIRICGNYTSTSGSLTTTGSTVEFNGSATQNVLTRTATFNNLLISNTSATVYSDENITVNGTTNIAASARLEMDGSTLNFNGAATVDGFLRNTDAAVNTSGGLTFNNGSTYEHNYSSFFSSGTIPTATWSVGSTCSVIGIFLNGTAPSGLSQSFHHFTWNCTNQVVNSSLNGALTTINGNFNVLSTGSSNLRLIGNGAYTLNVGGDMNMTGGSLVIKTGNNTAIVNLTGNYTQTSGDLDFCSSNNGAVEIRISGNYNRSGSGNLTTSGNTSTNGMFRFQGTTQSITQNTTGTSSYVDYRIASGVTSLLSNLAINTAGLSSYPTNLNIANGGTLDCGTFLISGVNSVNTSVIVSSGGTIRTANSDGLTASDPAGTVRTDNRTYSSGGHYVFNANTNQNTGNFFTVTTPTTNTVANLTIDNTGSSGNNTVTMNSGSNISVSSQLNFPATNQGALDVLTNRISITNNSTGAVNRIGEGYVIGELQRAITTGTNTYSFHVGTSTGYSPVAIDYVTVTNSGNAVVKANNGPHPNAATHGLSQTRYVNRWWNIVNSGITSSASTNINAFSYPSADLVGGATSSSVQLLRWNGTAWSYPSFTTGTNQISGTNLNNTTMYGQFFAADCESFEVSVTPSSPEVCSGSSVGLTASTNFGSPTYSWSPGTALSATNVAAVTANPTSNQTYVVTATTATNCVATDTVTVVVLPRPTGTLGGSQVVCAGSTVTLYLNVTGTGPFSGTLSPGAIPFSGAGPVITVNVTPASTTTYTIATLSDSQCNAQSGDLSGFAALTYQALPTAGISGPSAVCQGSSATITFSGTANAVVTYTINGGSNQFITLNGSGSATLNTGAMWTNATYDLVSVQSGLCSNSATGSVAISVNDVPEAEIDGATSICSGSSTTISFYGTPSATVTYKINGGPDQFISLNGSGVATLNTGVLTSNTTYLLTSVSNGTCSQNIGMSAAVTMLGSTYYQDSDGDGYGNPLVSQVACSTPIGYVDNDDDCCDTNADINPGTEWWADNDGDGFGGFVSEVGCVSGVTCSSATWPAQTIPYYAPAHGGTPYVLDCQDAIASAYPGSTELCNNAIDDDCDGLINEGCAGIPNDNWANAINVNLNNPNTHYPNCLSLNGNLVNANISPQGNAANVPPGAGRDVWYKFVAPSTGVQIKVVPLGFDAIIELQNSSAVEVNCELANNTSGGMEILNFNSLTPGQTYYVGVRNRDVSVGGTFTICVSPLMPSGCSYSTPMGGFTLCSNFKAVYRGATSYTFSFTGTGGNAAFPYVTTSATTTGLVPFSHPALDVRHGGVYSVKVDANYNLVDGNGNPEVPFTVLGSLASVNCTGVTMAAQPTIEVKSHQVCPTVVLRTHFLQWAPVTGNVNACGAINFTYEFTKVSDCAGTTVIGSSFEVTTSGNQQYLNLSAAFPSNLGSVGYWSVRIRPNYSYMTGTYGPAKVISVSGSSASAMLTEPAMEDNSEKVEVVAVEAGIYPNPNHGDMVNIQMNGEVDGEVFIRVMNAIGQVVYSDMMIANGTLHTSIEFKQTLTSGFYSVEISNNGKTFTEKMLVQK